jgi:hypothetical protein
MSSSTSQTETTITVSTEKLQELAKKFKNKLLNNNEVNDQLIRDMVNLCMDTLKEVKKTHSPNEKMKIILIIDCEDLTVGYTIHNSWYLAPSIASDNSMIIQTQILLKKKKNSDKYTLVEDEQLYEL